MKTDTKYHRHEWDEFFALWQQVNELLRRKAEDFVVADRIAELHEGDGFGSSDRWHVVFGVFNYADYDQDSKKYSIPSTGEEMQERVKSFLRDRMLELDMGIHMTEAFLEDPDGMARLFAPA